MNPTRRILFAVSDTGGGHRSAAQALATAVADLAAGSVECEIIDLLRLTQLPLVRAAPELYERLANGWMPLYDAGFRLTDGPRRARLMMELIFQAARRRLIDEIEQRRPHLVVAAHPLVAALAALARQSAGLDYRLVSVVTDLVSLHATWGCTGVDRCLVPTREALVLLRRRGMPEAQLRLGSFPVHHKFTHNELSRQEARQMLNLAAERFTLLITSGALGAGRVGMLVKLLHQALPGAQILVVAGKNRALFDQLQAAELGSQIVVYGYVTFMEQLMAASDVVIGKAGPGTLMEALAIGRPLIVTEAVGRQEQGNIDFVLNHALGAYCPTFEQVVAALHELADPNVYRAVCLRLDRAKPRGGATPLARLLLDEVAGQWVEQPERESAHSRLAYRPVADGRGGDDRLIGAERHSEHDHALGEFLWP